MEIGFYHFAAGIKKGGGKPVYTRKITQALSKECNVALYTASPAFPSLHDSDVEVIELQSWPGHRLHQSLSRSEPIRLNSSLSYLNARRSGLHKHITQTDVLVTHKWYEDLVISRTAEPLVIHHRHAVGSYGIGRKAHDLLAAPERQLANSGPIKRGLKREQDVEIDGIVGPGVDVEQFRPDVEPAFNAAEPTILFVGRFEHVKSVETLLSAFASLSDRAQLLYLGDGSKRETLEQRARELGIADSVEVNGVIPHDEIHRYYAAADIVCHPSRYEGFGMTNLEAMASGTPLVTTPFGFVEESGSANETHLEVQPSTPSELARVLESLLDDPERRATLGENARELAKDHTWDRRAVKMLDLCETFLEEHESS